MDAALNQILGLFDHDPALTPAEIGETLHLAPEVVDACLRIHSPAYRELAADAPKTNDQEIRGLEIDATVVAALREQLVQTALRSDNEGLRFRSARYLVEEATGRNRARAFRQDKNVMNVNLTTINQRFEQLRARRVAPPVYDAPSPRRASDEGASESQGEDRNQMTTIKNQ